MMLWQKEKEMTREKSHFHVEVEIICCTNAIEKVGVKKDARLNEKWRRYNC